MSGAPADPADREQRLGEVVAAYIEATEAGQRPDRNEIVAAHPDLASELAEFFAGHDALRRLAGASQTTNGGDDEPDETTSPDALGDFGDYELIEQVGAGGMGVVYRARHRALNRVVALKRLIAGRWASAADVRRFRAEAELAAQLDHPNIVPVYEVGEHNGHRYFSMRLMEGGSLADDPGRYADNPRAAAALVADVARAVHHAHQRGLLHRDLKPSNVLLDAEGRPHVSDFGLAKPLAASGSLTQSGAIVGSPSYMAPEQAEGRRGAVTTATDVYGLGALLYTLVTGRPPFRGETVLETLELVRDAPPIPPCDLNPRVERDLDAVCLHCLEKTPERRYSSALALADDLDCYLRGEPTVARPLSLWALGWRWARHRRKTVAAVAVLLAATGSLTLGVAQTNRLREARLAVARREQEIRQRDLAARRMRYTAEVRRAARRLANGEVAAAIGALGGALDGSRPDRGEPDFRGFDWWYLRGMTQWWRASWVGHDGRDVYHVEFSPDGQSLATAGGDGTARVWDAATGRLRVTLRGHEGDVDWVNFAPDGKRLVTAGDDATVRVWSAADGALLRTLGRFAEPAVAALFTPDGHDLVAAGRRGDIVRWDAADGQRKAAIDEPGSPRRWVEALALSPDGSILLAAGHGAAQRYLLTGGGLRVDGALKLGPSADCIAFSPDGRTVAATGSGSVHAYLGRPHDGADLTVLAGPPTGTYSLAFSPDGRMLATGDSSGVLRVWELATRTFRDPISAHPKRIWSVAYAPNGRTLATASRDGNVRLWDVADTAGRRVFRHPAFVDVSAAVWPAISFSRDGSRVIVANHVGQILDCDLRLQTDTLIPSADHRLFRAVHVAPGARALAVVGTAVDIHDLSGARAPRRLPVTPLGSRSVAWSPDGRRLAIVELTGFLSLWDVTNGRVIDRVSADVGPGSSPPVFVPRGDIVVRFGGTPAMSDPNPDLALNGRRPEFVAWEPATGRLRRRLVPDGQGGFGVIKLVVSPNGRTLAPLVENGLAVELIDLATLTRTLPLVGHTELVTDVAFSPDALRIATASLDRTVRIWDVGTGQELLSLEGHTAPVHGVAFAPDGQALASCSVIADGTAEIIVWLTHR